MYKTAVSLCHRPTFQSVFGMPQVVDCRAIDRRTCRLHQSGVAAAVSGKQKSTGQFCVIVIIVAAAAL